MPNVLYEGIDIQSNDPYKAPISNGILFVFDDL